MTNKLIFVTFTLFAARLLKLPSTSKTSFIYAAFPLKLGTQVFFFSNVVRPANNQQLAPFPPTKTSKFYRLATTCRIGT